MPRSNWAREPQLLSLHVWSLCSATGEAAIVRGLRTAMKSGPRLPQLEKAPAQKRRPNIAINKLEKKKITIKKKKKTERKSPVIFGVGEDELQEEPGSMASPISLLHDFSSYLRVPRSTQGLASSFPVPGHPLLVSYTLKSTPMPSPPQETAGICLCHHALLGLVSKPSLVPSYVFLAPSFFLISLAPGLLGKDLEAGPGAVGRALTMTVSQCC